jgi:hypothetical protein
LTSVGSAQIWGLITITELFFKNFFRSLSMRKDAQRGGFDHFLGSPDRHPDSREISFPAFDRSRMVLPQRFTGTNRGRAAEAVLIQIPAKAHA